MEKIYRNAELLISSKREGPTLSASFLKSTASNQNSFVQALLYLEFFPLLLFSYNTSLRGFLYRSDKVLMVTLILSLVCGASAFFITAWDTPLRFSCFHLGWLAIWCWCIMTSADLRSSAYGSTIYFSCILLVMLFSSFQIMWVSPAIRIMCFFTCIHAFVTVFSFFNTDFFNRLIRPILDPSPFITGYQSGLTGHYSTNGIYLGIGLILMAAGIISRVERGLGAKAIAFLVLIALLLTEKRGDLLFGVLAIFIMYFVYHSDQKIKRWGKAAFAFLGVLALVLIISTRIPQVTKVVSRLTDNQGDITNGRIYLYRIAWELFQTHPVFGIGWGAYKYEFAKRTPLNAYHVEMLNAHNIYLQLLCEVGIVGLLLFLTVVLPTAYQTYKMLSDMAKGKLEGNHKIKYYLTFSLGMQSYFLMYGFTGNPLYDVQVLFPYIIACAAFYAVKYRISRRTADDRISSFRYFRIPPKAPFS